LIIKLIQGVAGLTIAFV